MRAALLILVLCSAAHAGNRVVVLTDRDGMPTALQGALADRHVEVTTQPPPAGALRLDRAATAQHVAMANDADVGVWIDADEVWVVSADGRLLRHARVPADASPDTFAEITTNLLDEVFAPVAVDVHVDIQPPSALLQPPPPPNAVVLAPAPTAVASVDPASDRWKHVLVELGPTVSPATYGGEIEAAWPLARNLRLGVFAGMNQVFGDMAIYESGTRFYDSGLELRYVGDGRVHLEVGFAGGVETGVNTDGYDPYNDVFYSERETGGLLGLRIGLAGELANGNVELAVEPMMMFGFGEDKPLTVMASLRWGLPL